MTAKVAGKLTELKYARSDRGVVCGASKAHASTLRAFNRAIRQAARLALRTDWETF